MLKKIFGNTLNENLFNLLWNNKKHSFFFKTFYVIIPIIPLAILYIILFNHNALIIENGYGFFNDLTNFFALTYMFIFMYYVSGYYSTYSNNIISFYKDKMDANNSSLFEKDEKKLESSLFKIILHLFAILLAIIFGTKFINISNLNVENWYNKLGNDLLYYRIIICFTWYMAINLFFSTGIISLKLYNLLKYDLKLSISDSDLSCGMKKFLRVNYINIAMAFYVMIWVIIIIISDQKAATYNIYNAFYFNLNNQNIISVTLFVISVLIIYFTFAFLPFFEAKKHIYGLVDEELKKYKYPKQYSEIKNISKLKHSLYSFKNIIFPILTTFVPIIIAIIELVVTIIKE